MNFDRLKKSVGMRMQLEPVPIRLDDLGRELPASNDDWIVMAVNDDAIELRGIGFMPYALKLGKDHVHHYTSNPHRSVEGGLQYGFLTLIVQVFMQRNEITLCPCARPGERVDPLPVQIKEEWVDIRYPSDTGLQARLEASGYRVAWCRKSLLPRRRREGWEPVVAKDDAGVPTTFHLRDRPEDQVLVIVRAQVTSQA